MSGREVEAARERARACGREAAAWAARRLNPGRTRTEAAVAAYLLARVRRVLRAELAEAGGAGEIRRWRGETGGDSAYLGLVLDQVAFGPGITRAYLGRLSRDPQFCERLGRIVVDLIGPP